VRREDLLLFVNAGLTATGQGGFYHGAIDERLSLSFLHLYIAENYRSLYTLLLAAGLNDHNTAHALFTLLASGAPPEPGERALENELIGKTTAKLPPQRAYRLFERLATSGVNNRRTRAVIAGYLRGRKNLAFDAIKYRHRLKKAVLHSHAGLSREVKRFLFEGAATKPYSDPMLETYRKAHYDQRHIYELPFTVAQGLAQRKKIPRDEFMEKIGPRMTEREKLRWQQAGAAALDPSSADLVELCIYFLRLPHLERLSLLPALRQRAAQLVPALQLPEWLARSRVAVVLDRSRSSYGSAQARRRPLAVAMAIHLALEAACASYSAHWSHPTADLIDLQPTGHTALGEPLLEALAGKPEVVIVVSDGRENAPSGACQAIASAFAARLPDAPMWIHFNPVFDPDDFQPMALGPSWPVVGIRRAEDLATGFVLASFAKGRCQLAELEAYLKDRAASFLEGSPELALP
jgi:hypothetical protein